MDINNTIGYRHSNIVKVLSNSLSVDLLDFAFTKNQNTFLKKVINKLFIFPDIYWLSIPRYKKRIQEKLSTQQYGAVVVATLPHSFLTLASFIKKQQPNLNVIVDLTDPLTANVSYLHYSKLYKNYINWYETKHFKNVDQLIVLNEEIKSYYQEKYPSIKKITVIEQAIGENEVPITLNDLKLNSIKELVYAGMLYERLREPFELYKAVTHSSITWRLSIYGSFKKKFLPPTSERIIYNGSINKTILHQKLSEYDIIVFIDNFYGIQSPGKILENLATNKPVLFIYENENSPTLKFTKEFEGVFYSKNNSKEIGDTIDKIIDTKIISFKRDLSKHYWHNIIKETDYI